ncbi:putative nucleotidyltransferase substrate binding domain-containing protein [Desulfoplanes sp.]
MSERPWYGDAAARGKTMLRLVERGDLEGIRSGRIALVRDGLANMGDAAGVSRDVSLFNKDLVGAIIATHTRDHAWLGGCTWLEFGSGGRQEQVLSSDQDNGLIYPVHPDGHDLDEVTQDMVMTLDGAGMRLCPGGVMATSENWRGTGEEWSERLRGWLANPVEKGPWQYGLILDFRPLAGPKGAALCLREELWEYVRTRPLVLRLLAAELEGYRIPLTMWGNFVLIKKGPFQGGLDIKKSGLVRMATAARILALKYGLTMHHTLDRVHELARQGHIGERLAKRMARFWSWTQGKRLSIGLEELGAGRTPHNVIYPYRLDRGEMLLLKDGLHAVEKLSRLVLEGAGF